MFLAPKQKGEKNAGGRAEFTWIRLVARYQMSRLNDHKISFEKNLVYAFLGAQFPLPGYIGIGVRGNTEVTKNSQSKTVIDWLIISTLQGSLDNDGLGPISWWEWRVM